MQFLVSIAQLVKWLSTRFICKADYQKKGDLPLHHYVQLSSGAHAFYRAQDSEETVNVTRGRTSHSKPLRKKA
jgi:hypothetical protein